LKVTTSEWVLSSHHVAPFVACHRTIFSQANGVGGHVGLASLNLGFGSRGIKAHGAETGYYLLSIPKRETSYVPTARPKAMAKTGRLDDQGDWCDGFAWFGRRITVPFVCEAALGSV